MEVVVFTSDKYLELLKGLSYSFNKHWGADQSVKVLGFAPPDFDLPANFEFLSAGNQEDFPAKAFCDPFRPILESLDSQLITTLLEDTFLIHPVHRPAIEEGVQLLHDGAAQKIDLFWGTDYQNSTSSRFNDTFNEYAQNVDYRCSMSPSIINKDYFLSFFEPNMTIWEFELNNMNKAKNDGARLLFSKNRPLAPWINVIVKGKFNFKQHEKMITSSTGRNFGWNRYQRLEDDEYDTFLQYKEWTAS